MLAWDHLNLILDEVNTTKKLSPENLQELASLSTEFPHAVRLLANGSVIQPRHPGLPYVIVDANAVVEVLQSNLHCCCVDFAFSLADDTDILACRHYLAVRLYQALAKNN
ncbi:hypothetical protein BIW11_03288 [Tropilaelaps mercedesae]|uniref:Uncharacterized protein n=1 Tax=Tropilaelaps mercedesae TaxID=418985 RepID=A0A1V9XP21_9ACAR|nr:hypothetical protein BIW11_03288 [Tropilaelaps mercedesae]